MSPRPYSPIPVERLLSGTIIHRADDFEFGPFGSFAEVQDIEFDGYGYTVTARLLTEAGHAGEDEVQFIVDASQSVEFGGLGEPRMRSEADVPDEEVSAKLDADIAATNSLITKIEALHAQTRAA